MCFCTIIVFMKNNLKIVFVIFFIGLGLLILTKNFEKNKNIKNSLTNYSVKVGDENFDLLNGKAEKEIVPGSATKNKLYIFAEPVLGDLNGDGKTDVAEILVNEPGGSGSFFYAVLLIKNDNGYKVTGTMYLGDRIAPQNINIVDGRAVYNFAERKAGEPFSLPPSLGKSIWVHYDEKNNEIGEWVKDFEGDGVKNGTVFYKNEKYGFSFSLPNSWGGYNIIENDWEGDVVNSKGEVSLRAVSGPKILIRHPLWKTENPRQDIPVMVFTLAQWNDMQTDKFHVGAAPINPSELGRNSKYVFALPARYNFAYLTGFEEVDQILESKPLKAF